MLKAARKCANPAVRRAFGKLSSFPIVPFLSSPRAFPALAALCRGLAPILLCVSGVPVWRRSRGRAISGNLRRIRARQPTPEASAPAMPWPDGGTDARPASKDRAMRCRLSERLNPGTAPERAGRGDRTPVQYQAIPRQGPSRSRDCGCVRRDGCSIATGAFARS